MTEKAIAEKLEVSRAILRRIRKGMRKPWDWRKDGAEIVFTERGLKLLGEKFGIRREDLNGAAVLPESVAMPVNLGTNTTDEVREALPQSKDVKDSRGPVRPLVRTMTVTRVYDNVKMLLAKDEEEKRWEVIVGDNRNFMIGLKFPAEPAPANPGYLRLIGKVPRTRGKWMPIELREQEAEIERRK